MNSTQPMMKPTKLEWKQCLTTECEKYILKTKPYDLCYNCNTKDYVECKN